MVQIHLSGRMTLEGAGVRVQGEEFPGRQGRVAFALLVGERPGPVSRSLLVDTLWPEGPPPSWSGALSAVLSKLRSLLSRVGADGAAVLIAGSGSYELRLPAGAWVDHEAMGDAIHEAEAALRQGDWRSAYGPSAVAHHIARRPFLPGEEGPWIEQRRQKLAAILIRALECRAQVYMENGEHVLAVEAAREAVALSPFRESAYRLLMRAHTVAGNTAEALRVYEECRAFIANELGVGPSQETRAVHAEVLRSL